MQFNSFSDFINYIATGPGFILNLVWKTIALVFYHLPILLFNIVVSIAKFVFYLPVFLYKCVVWAWTFVLNIFDVIYDYIFLREWSWNDLGYFPKNRPEKTTEILREGIDQPFARFAGDISESVKRAMEPLIDAMDWITAQLSSIPWIFLFPAIVGIVWLTSRNVGVTLLAVVAMFYLGWFGLTEPDLNAAAAAWETVALMIMSILLCVAVGVPLGIMMAFSDLIERTVKPILDVMQTMPSFVYLIPVLIIFGVSKVAGLIAVTIYAMPPVIRLTNLGIRLVAFDVIEAANAFGATYRQRLTGVLIPLALPNIFAGINQTIMMALAMVVIAALVGAGGLGQLVLQAQSNTQLGRGLEYGFAIVLIAIVIDRTFYVVGERMQEHRTVGH